MFSRRQISDLLLCFFVLHMTSPVRAENEQEQFFETHVRPLLIERCIGCHGAEKQQGELRLDHRQYVLNEGANGTAVVPGNLDESRLWQVIQYDEFDVQMPPAGKLKDNEIEILRSWIESGAFWPEEAPPEEPGNTGGIPYTAEGAIDYAAAIASHWAYQPVERPEVPIVPEAGDSATSIDLFVMKPLHAAGLTLSERADRQTLIRRLSFDLRGLPPSFAEVQNFVQDDRPVAYEELIDRYLADPAYGERWGRYWLDLARYADTKGYVFRDNRNYPYSYTYRDYVIEAFNNDKPYDEFIKEQLAADQLGYAENDPRLAALGFLTIGPRFLNRTPDIIDDRIDVVTRGLMGMTMGCARCHDHKFDPLPTTDYYSLYGVFASCFEPELPPLVGDVDTSAPGYDAFAAELAKRQQALDDYKRTAHDELLKQARDRLEDYLPAAIKLMGFLPADLELTPQNGPLRERLIGLWKLTLERFAKEQHPVFLPAARLLTIEENELPQQAPPILDELSANDAIPQSLIDRLRESSSTRLEVVQAYTAALGQARDAWEHVLQENSSAERLEDEEQETLRQVLYGPGSLSDLEFTDESPLFERDNRDRIRDLQKQVDEWRATSPDAPPRSMVLLDSERPVEPVVFIRGNVGRRGERVPRRGPQILNPDPDAVYQTGSGRLELAKQIVSPQNPLTARVLVNRVWMWHFGTPLVESTADFGLRTEAPVHRELLDDLAWKLVFRDNWSIKKLHKRILLSQVWQQSSHDRPAARKVDPENRLYWRQNRQRLNFEAMRDAILSSAGELDRTLGGRAMDIEQQPFPRRRTVYAFIDRNNPSGLLRTFDFPSPNSSSSERSETTVPQQALFSMNSPFLQEMAQSLAARIAQQASNPREQVQRAIELTYSRTATDDEVQQMLLFLESADLEQLSQALLLANEFHFID